MIASLVFYRRMARRGGGSKHYRNNPEAALPEKRRAMELFEHGLAVALG